MREIKFRAWDRIEKEMDYDNFDLPIMEFNEGIVEMQEERYDLMQFTGLKDKNGKEIYEGDIVNVTNFDKMIVYFRDGCFGWGTGNSFDTFYSSDLPEIIGNIYENPELLGEVK